MNTYFLIFTLATSAMVAMDGKQEGTAPDKKQLPLLTGGSLSMRVHPDDKEKVDKAYAAALEKRKEHNAHKEFLKNIW